LRWCRSASASGAARVRKRKSRQRIERYGTVGYPAAALP